MIVGINFIIFLVFLLLLKNHKVTADDCEQFPPELNMNLQQCCSFANITDKQIEIKIQAMIKEKASSGNNNFEMACKVAQFVFEEMKLIKDNLIDRDLYAKMIDAKIPKDVDFWKPPLKNGFEQCQHSVLTDVTKITELFSNHPFNIKKVTCDPQYLVMLMCLHLDSFVNCPEKAWKVTGDESNHKPCDTVKSWFGKCGKDLNALRKIVLKGTGMN